MPDAVKQARAHRLGEAGQRLAESFARRFAGRTVEVLVEEEGPAPGVLEGYTPEYVRVVFPGPDSLKRSIAKVRIRSAGADVSQGELADAPGRVNSQAAERAGGADNPRLDQPMQRIG